MDILKLDLDYRVALTSCADETPFPLHPPSAFSSTWYHALYARQTRAQQALYARSHDLDFYLLETGLLLEHYGAELRRPMKWVFGQKNTAVSRVKREIINTFQEVISRLYISDVFPRRFDGDHELTQDTRDKQGLLCACGGTDFAPVPDSESIIMCQLCSAQIELQPSFSYDNARRVNISQRASNEKRSHFLNCFNQYAGVQKITLAPTLLESIDHALEKYNLRKERVTKEHIRIILQDLNLYRTYSEYITLIYCKIVGVNMDNVIALRSAIMNDFDRFNELYQRRFADKKPYNYQQLLFQFLRRHGYPCEYSEFNFLKTTERKIYHEAKQRQLFDELGWNYTPLL